MNPARLFFAVVATLLAFAAPACAEANRYLFTYFVGNGADGLHLAASEDGYNWKALKKGESVLKPEVGESKLMRDPCLLEGPDGTFHLVWTTAWEGKTIGYASSKDLVNWSKQKAIPVMAHEPTARNCWAPEVVYDEASGEFLLFWATTIPGHFPETQSAAEKAYNHRMYATRTKDFETFTPTTLFYEPGFNVIDATIFKHAGKFHLIIKDETVTPPKKHLRIAHADTVAGPWSELSEPFTRDWVEGPTALVVGPDVLVYFDVYREKHYGAMRSRDLRTWEDVTGKISLPPGARHGTMIPISAERLKALE